jgi:predicted kinase
VIVAGLPGTGKSALCRELSRQVNGIVLDKDSIRDVLFGPHHVEYSTEQDDFVGQVMLAAAEYLFRGETRVTVFLDGRTFSRRYQIDQAVETAGRFQKPWRILECVCDEGTVRRRLARDEAEGRHLAKNRTFGLYLEVKRHFEPIVLPKLQIDTAQPVETCVAQGLAYLTGGNVS